MIEIILFFIPKPLVEILVFFGIASVVLFFLKRTTTTREYDKFRYHQGLAERFVSDYKLPINNVHNKDIFMYSLKLFEREFKALTKWNTLWELIDRKFAGDAGKFLDEYYNIRDRIIQDTLNNPAYKEFNDSPDVMKKYEIPKEERPNVSHNNVFKGDSVGKTFLSIDLRKANFQALKFVNPAIVKHTNSYEEFIATFTDLDYVKTSKYTRQVIFGKMNPSRHITVEKYMTLQIWKTVAPVDEIVYNFSLVSMANDELVLELCNPKFVITDAFLEKLKTIIESKTGFVVRCEAFSLASHRLVSKDTGRKKDEFYIKKDVITGTESLVCVPLPYYLMVYKLVHGMEVELPDKCFVYEKTEALFNEDFELE